MNNIPFGKINGCCLSITQQSQQIAIVGVEAYVNLFKGALSLKVGDGQKKMSRKVSGWAEDGHRYDEID